MKLKLLALNCFALLVFFSCKEEAKQKEEIVEEEVVVEEEVYDKVIQIEVEAENSLSSGFQTLSFNGTEEIALENEAAGSAFEYELNIPKAGRYRFEVEASNVEGETIIWMEDYVDNTDGRTYDITSKIYLNENDEILFKEGSPLNKGIHKMKLHIDNGRAQVNKFRFILMKSHRKTPEVLTQNMDGDEFEIVWADEFDEDGMPDTTKWTYDFGNWGWGNNELQYYTRGKKENARIENGNLIIEAIKDENGNWTSTRLTTREKETFVYGRIEFRAKVPVEKGNWSAGWTLGDAYVDELSWPYCGEIDIMESVGFEIDDETGKGKAHASIHVPAYYFKLGNQPTSTIEVDDMKNDYHTYRIDWESERIIAYVDDVPYFEFDDNTNANTWPFNEPQNIILNLAMGGGWGGALGMDTTVTNQKLYVDYVRVYQKK